MTEPEFQTEINRLASVFGGAYKTERAALIWHEMQNLSADSFKRIVDKLIGECRQAPMIQEFREAASPERERMHSIRKSQRAAEMMSKIVAYASCSNCHDTGAVLARHKVDKSPWAFRCGCSHGRNEPRNYPKWESGYLKDFEVVG